MQKIAKTHVPEKFSPHLSATPFTTSAPSFAGSTWTRNGRFPNGVSTTLTMAFATSVTSAPGAAVRAKPCMISSPSFAVGPDEYSLKRLLSPGCVRSAMPGRPDDRLPPLRVRLRGRFFRARRPCGLRWCRAERDGPRLTRPRQSSAGGLHASIWSHMDSNKSRGRSPMPGLWCRAPCQT